MENGQNQILSVEFSDLAEWLFIQCFNYLNFFAVFIISCAILLIPLVM